MADKHVIIFTKRVSGSSVQVKRKNVKLDDIKEGISYKGRTHLIDLARPVYRLHSKNFYVMDLDEGQQFVMPSNEHGVSTKLMDATFKKEIAKQLVAGLYAAGGMDWKMIMLFLLAGLGGGVGIGVIVGKVAGI